jgi:hypothetical protein
MLATSGFVTSRRLLAGSVFEAFTKVSAKLPWLGLKSLTPLTTPTWPASGSSSLAPDR